MPNVFSINQHLQSELKRRGLSAVTAVDAAKWLDAAGLLNDSQHRPGLPLRNLLRDGMITGQRQESNRRWFIDQVNQTIDAGQARAKPKSVPVREGSKRRSSSGFRRSDSDESYIIDLCDRVLNRKASRQHRFPFLVGDAGHTLPCDAYYADLKLVVEYRERQHVEAVGIMDRRDTVSGVKRGEQRRIYDQRRRDVLPKHGIDLVELTFSDFEHDGRKRLGRTAKDEAVVRRALNQWL